ncbi:MAG: DUF4238 domain-containing protein, partial [Balneola sp.]
YYLKGFTKNRGNQIWTYRKDGSCFPVSLDKIAQETNMYSGETENYITSEIENPANAVIKKIRERVPIDIEDKKNLTRYMISLIQRTPESYQDYLQNSEETLDQLLDDEKQKLKKLIIDDPKNEDKYTIIVESLEQIVSDFKLAPPKEAWEMAIKPDLYPRFNWALMNKKWNFYYADNDRSAFITSDNPIFYFKGFGLSHPKSQISFPVSENICLIASWDGELENEYIKISEKAIKEINYRTASNIYSFAFYSKDKDWVKKIISKKDYEFKLLI